MENATMEMGNRARGGGGGVGGEQRDKVGGEKGDTLGMKMPCR